MNLLISAFPAKSAIQTPELTRYKTLKTLRRPKQSACCYFRNDHVDNFLDAPGEKRTRSTTPRKSSLSVGTILVLPHDIFLFLSAGPFRAPLAPG